MVNTDDLNCRYFISYSGVKLPLKLVNEMGEADMDNRNTFFRGYFDAAGRLVLLQQVVYGDIELQHEYAYHEDGTLARAVIIDADEEENVLEFDAQGQALA